MLSISVDLYMINNTQRNIHYIENYLCVSWVVCQVLTYVTCKFVEQSPYLCQGMSLVPFWGSVSTYVPHSTAWHPRKIGDCNWRLRSHTRQTFQLQEITAYVCNTIHDFFGSDKALNVVHQWITCSPSSGHTLPLLSLSNITTQLAGPTETLCIPPVHLVTVLKEME